MKSHRNTSATHRQAILLVAAVTLAVSKRKGANAIGRGGSTCSPAWTRGARFLPTCSFHHPQLWRNGRREIERAAVPYADRRISVTALIGLTLGLREPLHRFHRDPCDAGPHARRFYLYGYTLNRITLFALIFSIGILVDDAIVIVENIVRHARLPQTGPSPCEVAVDAVDEVGNATILATLDGDCRDPADRFRHRAVGTLYAAHPHRCVGGDGLFADRRPGRDAVGRRPDP